MTQTYTLKRHPSLVCVHGFKSLKPCSRSFILTDIVRPRKVVGMHSYKEKKKEMRKRNRLSFCSRGLSTINLLESPGKKTDREQNEETGWKRLTARLCDLSRTDPAVRGKMIRKNPTKEEAENRKGELRSLVYSVQRSSPFAPISFKLILRRQQTKGAKLRNFFISFEC